MEFVLIHEDTQNVLTGSYWKVFWRGINNSQLSKIPWNL